MRLIFLGSGSAFTTDDNYNSNMLLENSHHHNLLIDCGSDARHALTDLGLSHCNIQSVYVSHLHADHVGGLEWLAFTRMFDSDCNEKPTLYLQESLVKPLWENTLSGGLKSLEDKNAELSTYFRVKLIPKDTFNWEGLDITLVQTLHTKSCGKLSPSYGLFFSADGLNILITTDTQFSPEHYKNFYEKADIIFHDCETIGKPSSVHATYKQLTTLDANIKKKIWLYHYNNNKLPDAKKDGFRGFVKKGQIFDFSDKKTLG